MNESSNSHKNKTEKPSEFAFGYFLYIVGIYRKGYMTHFLII